MEEHEKDQTKCVRCGELLGQHHLRGGSLNLWCPNGDGVWIRPKEDQ